MSKGPNIIMKAKRSSVRACTLHVQRPGALKRKPAEGPEHISKETAELTRDANLPHVTGPGLPWNVIARLGGDEPGAACECSLFRMFLNHQAEDIYCSILWGPVGHHHGTQLANDSVSKDLSLFWGGYSKPQGPMAEGRGPSTDKYLSALVSLFLNHTVAKVIFYLSQRRRCHFLA